jgi:hypothetical protein
VNAEGVIYQHCCNDPLNPGRSNALEVRFQGVRQRTDLHDPLKPTGNAVLVALM